MLDQFNKLLHLKKATPQKAILNIERQNLAHPEGYVIRIKPDAVEILIEKPVGLFRALHTFAKIIKSYRKHEDGIPCLEINDFPHLSRRGFMLDVSRCKVPTMQSIFSLIDLLAELSYNELQLYIEHTFAFKNHNEVWKDASPLTSEEIQIIDKYCRERFIELVPNLNSFGHFERWLMHSSYKHLAECPNGFRREEPFMVRDHGTTLKPNQESLDFINQLYEEFLPNFKSKSFNVGMDEPWELGQGWSKNRVKKRGKDTVYLNHLEGIRSLVERHGKKMQFWADVLLEKPENAKLLPPDSQPIIWGYEANHPFDQQASQISSCGLSFCLAPGTGTWRSFTGRWPSTRENLANASTNASKHGAQGILLTSWGDCGNHQPWPIFYPGIFLGAHWAWRGKEAGDLEIAKAVGLMVYNSSNSTAGEVLIELGKLDQKISSQIPNASLAWNLLFTPQPEKLPNFLQENSSSDALNRGLDWLEHIFSLVSTIRDFKDSGRFKCEILLAVEMAAHSLKWGKFLLEKRDKPKIKHQEILDKYQENWLTKARVGGLAESNSLLEKALLAHSA